MDIMNSKKTLLSLIKGGAVLGSAPTGSSVVKFAWATSLSKIGTASDGTVTFYADTTNGSGLVLVGDQIVSSKIMDLAWAQSEASGAKNGEKVVTLKYITGLGENAQLNTVTLDVIDKVAAKAIIEDYFTDSNTITITDGTAEVNVDSSTILIDTTNKYLKSGLNIFYKAPVTTAGSEENAKIQLRDAHNAMLSEIDVADIIGNGVVDHTSYDSKTNTLSIFFKTAAGGTQEVKINLSELFDIDDWAVETGSEDFLSLTIDASTAEIGVKLADVTFTAAHDNVAADLTVNTTAGKVLDAADAIPAIKSYIDAVSADNGIAVESKNDYIDASVDANNNKKINLAAQVAELTVGKVGDADSTLSGTANKLVDGADAASKVQSFVNARLSEEISKLDASIDSTPGTFISAGVAEVDGKITSVVVHENIGSISGTATTLTGTTGLIDGADAATAVKTYVDGQINALDSELDITSTDASLTFDASVVNGKIVEGHIGYVKSTVEFSDADGLDLTGTAGFVTGEAIAEIKEYVDAKSGSLDSQIVESDASTYVTVTTGMIDGALADASSSVAVTYATVTAAPGDITVTQNGIVKGDVLEAAIEGALTWTVLQ